MSSDITAPALVGAAVIINVVDGIATGNGALGKEIAAGIAYAFIIALVEGIDHSFAVAMAGVFLFYVIIGKKHPGWSGLNSAVTGK